ncbi:MAG: Single-stranded nucleic acid binding R3H domain-containing protein [Parcubacteria group bacterium GW2011_GWA2_47_21]|nr:MAG: Single-stranded nucleic acid binding R3H domain-containing protein [Parcubacteria group bacterium GW2011_GWA2_47_21]
MESEKIKSIIKEFISKLGVSHESVEETKAKNGDGDKIQFTIKTAESGVLIGAKGTHFSALNHLLRKIVAKQLGETAPAFFVDVNDYREGLLSDLKTKVGILRERAISFKTNVEMEPMSSYERMLVHTLCEGHPNIKTESLGEGPMRRVVIKYVESV